MPPAVIWRRATPAPSAIPAAAAAYYLNVLKLDPHNPDLLSRTFLSVLSDGDIDEASKLAERLLAIDHTDRIARLVHRRPRTEAEALRRGPAGFRRSRCAAR